MKHDAITADAGDTAQDRADRLLAGLALVPAITDFRGVTDEAEKLAKRVRWFAGNDNRGMLGPNGLQPQVESLIRSAHYNGFDWRERFAPPADPRALTETIYRTAGGR